MEQVRFFRTELDIYYNKLYTSIQVVPQVVERLKTYDFRKLGNIKKVLNLGGVIA